MQLNEIIEENSLPTISKRTRISLGNLEAIVARDWSRLQKVQALGFLSILEREYGIDLSDMRAECRAYFESLPPVHEENGPLIVAPAETPAGSGTRLVLVLFALLAAGGGWIAFVSSDGNRTEENGSVSMVESSGGFYNSVLSMAKGWFGSEEEARVTEGELPELNEAWAGDNASVGSSKSTNATNDQGDTVSKTEEEGKEEQNSSPEKEEAQIIRQVKQEQAKAEELRQQAAQEGNATAGQTGELEALSKMILAPAAAEPAGENTTVAEDTQEQKELESQVPSLQQEAPVQLPKSEEMQTPVQSQEKTPSTQKEPAAVAGPVLFQPRAKIWVGYTNLKTMKRTAKVTRQEIPFDTEEGEYILATGHGQIDFKTSSGEKSLNDGKRHFFLISKGEVREISHEEFQRLNKSKVW